MFILKTNPGSEPSDFYAVDPIKVFIFYESESNGWQTENNTAFNNNK